MRARRRSTRRSASRSSPSVASVAASSATPATSTSPSCTTAPTRAEAERVAGGRPPLRRRRHPGRAHLGRSTPTCAPRVAAARCRAALDGWDGYLARWVSTWERQAYLRARAVAGDADLGARLVERLDAAAVEQPLTGDDEREVRRMKVRIEQERLGPGDDPGVPPEARAGARCPTSSSPCSCSSCGTAWSSRRRWRRSAALVEAGHLPLEEAEVLEEAYRFCEGTRNRTFLVVGQRRLAPHPARAGHPGRPLARAHRVRAARALPPGHPAGPAGGGAPLLRPGVSRVCGHDVVPPRSRGRPRPKGDDVPLHPQVKAAARRDGRRPEGRRSTS